MSPSPEIIGAQVVKAADGGVVYLASPYSKLVDTIGLDEAARLVTVAAGALIEEGAVVFSPIAHGHAVATAYGFDKLDAGMWMAQCYPMVSACAACVVLKLDGWRESSGVAEEVHLFQSQGKPVIYVEPESLIPPSKHLSLS